MGNSSDPQTAHRHPQDVALTRHEETMSSLVSGYSKAFRIRGDGLISVLVTLPDTTSADGDFFICLCNTETGTFGVVATATLTKTSGTAISAQLLQLANPGADWAKVWYDRDSGGAAGEITLSIRAW